MIRFKQMKKKYPFLLQSQFHLLFFVPGYFLWHPFIPETHAQDTSPPAELTLEGAIEEGLARSPQIIKSRALAEESSWKRVEHLASGFLPKLSISGAQYLATQYSTTIFTAFGGNFPGFFPNTTFSVDLKIPIFDGLANINNWQGSSLAEEASKKELSRAEFQLKTDIQLAFFQSLAAALLDDVAEENVKTLEDHLRQVSVQKQGGSATRYDMLRVEVQLNDGRADAIDAKDNVILTRRKLNQLIQLESDDRVLRGSLPIPEKTKVKDLTYTQISEERDDIQALQLKAQAAEKFHSAQKAWLSPNISLGGQYLLYGQQSVTLTPLAVTNTGNFQSAYQVALYLKWNLFDGGVSLAQANQAAYREIASQKDVDSAKMGVPYEFDYWKRHYLSNSDHYTSKKFDITRSEESVRLAKEEERAGTRTSTETLDAELDLFRARAGAVTSQVNAAEALIHLELVLGRSI